MRWLLFLCTLLLAVFALDAASSATLVLRLDWRERSYTRGQVFWSTGDQEFNDLHSARFDVNPGSQTISVPIPSRTRWLRVDPAEREGKFSLRGMRISSRLLPVDFTELDSPRAFQGWSAKRTGELKSLPPTEDGLVYESTGPDPYVMSPPLYGFAFQRWLQIFLVALGLAAAVALATPFFRRGRRPVYLAYTAGAAACAAAVLLAVPGLWPKAKWFSPDTKSVLIPGYDLSFYDRWGRPLSTRRGPLAIVIDPFTIYRNYPGQTDEKFRIDSDGFRESGPPRPGAPTAFVLGGSATFGLAAPSDEDTFVARMAAADPSTRYRNAAVVGFQSGQELAQMIHHLDAFKPARYLVVDGWNDIQQLQDPHGHDLGYNHSTFDLFQDHLFRLASLQASGLPAMRPPISTLGEVQGFEDKLVQRYLENVERMSSFAKSRGARFALAIQPVLLLKPHRSPQEEENSAAWKDSKPMKRAAATYRKLARETLALCTRLGVPCIDLNTEPGFSSNQETLFTDDCHLSPAGNQWVALALTDFINKNK